MDGHLLLVFWMYACVTRSLERVRKLRALGGKPKPPSVISAPVRARNTIFEEYVGPYTNFLTLSGTGEGVDASLPKVFRGCRKNALADLTKIWHSCAYLFYIYLQNLSFMSCQVTEL